MTHARYTIGFVIGVIQRWRANGVFWLGRQDPIQIMGAFVVGWRHCKERQAAILEREERLLHPERFACR